MKVQTVISIICIGCISIFAASGTVSISGTVKDESGAAIEGAALTLAGKPEVTAVTDAAGEFTLEGTFTTHSIAPFDIVSLNIGSSGNQLRFSLKADAADGRIAFISASGRNISQIELVDLKAGVNFVTLPNFSTGFYIVRVTVDGRTSTCKMVATGNEVHISEIFSNSSSTRLLNGTAAEPVDTIITEKEGYETSKTPVESYTLENIAIVMKEESVDPVECVPAQLPEPAALPKNEKLPSPFVFFDGTEMTRKDEWPCRRQEILDMAYKYIYGPMPPFAAPEVEVNGTVSSNGVMAEISYNGKSETMNFNTSGSGDILLISMGSGINPSGYSYRTFSVGGNSTLDSWAGKARSLTGVSPSRFVALGWGCNILCRAIASDPDGGIDTNKIMTTGCSATGKGAFFAGVFCEGIDLTVVVESGGFGDASFRMAEFLYYGAGDWSCSDPPQGIWKPDNGQFMGAPYTDANTSSWVVNNHSDIYKLPYDQHSLLACIAPRAACILTNQNGKSGNGEWCHLNGTGSALSAWAAEPIWNALGAPENFGFLMYTESGAPMHCSNPGSATTLAGEFFKRVFDGDENANTDVWEANDQDLQQPKSEWESVWADWDMEKTLE